MCGIAGLYCQSNRYDRHLIQQTLMRMESVIRHRGPDASGVWLDHQAGIGLAHRRLSILDLSATGSQPMQSRCGRYTLIYNGEIYNYSELRDRLADKAQLRGSSDTEVFLELIAEKGLQSSLQAANGMFAFALWNKAERTLTLARDRIGKKPLYFGWAGDEFLFGSELKVFLSHRKFEPEIDYDALTLFLKYHYVPVPFSIYKKVYKLQAGTVLSIGPKDIENRVPVKELYQKRESYWSAKDVVEDKLSRPFTGDDVEAAAELEELLTDATRKRLMSDVPLGALLSGGVDSSTIVALMQHNSQLPVKTFSMGFDNDAVSEATYAKEIANHLKTDHTELYMTGQDALDLIPQLPAMYDEPFADTSQIPTYLVSKLAREHVTVALTGDGGDELFCGYRRYMRGAKIYNKMQKVPYLLRKMVAKGLAPALLKRSAESRLVKFKDEMTDRTPLEMYLNRISKWRDPAALVLSGKEPVTEFMQTAESAGISDPMHLMMFTDVISYLTDDILVKVDRASMAVSLELRNPLLDHRVLEFAFSLPLALKTDCKLGKLVLRDVLYKHVPRELIERPKQGFSPPVRSWLSGPLNEWAEELLSPERLNREEIFDVQLIRKLWKDFNGGKKRLHGHIWNVLMFQAWNDWQKSFRATS